MRDPIRYVVYNPQAPVRKKHTSIKLVCAAAFLSVLAFVLL